MQLSYSGPTQNPPAPVGPEMLPAARSLLLSWFCRWLPIDFIILRSERRVQRRGDTPSHGFMYQSSNKLKRPLKLKMFCTFPFYAASVLIVSISALV